MSFARIQGIFILTLILVGCHRHSETVTQPSPVPPTTLVAPLPVTTVRVTDGLTTTALGGVAMTLDDGSQTTTSADGSLTFPSTVPTGVHSARFSGSASLTRFTYLRVPATDLPITLFPSTLDLAAFDQMIRASASRLQRWITPPPLVLVTSMLTLTDVNDATFVAAPDQMTVAEGTGLSATYNSRSRC